MRIRRINFQVHAYFVEKFLSTRTSLLESSARPDDSVDLALRDHSDPPYAFIFLGLSTPHRSGLHCPRAQLCTFNYPGAAERTRFLPLTRYDHLNSKTLKSCLVCFLHEYKTPRLYSEIDRQSLRFRVLTSLILIIRKLFGRLFTIRNTPVLPSERFFFLTHLHIPFLFT